MLKEFLFVDVATQIKLELLSLVKGPTSRDQKLTQIHDLSVCELNGLRQAISEYSSNQNRGLCILYITNKHTCYVRTVEILLSNIPVIIIALIIVIWLAFNDIFVRFQRILITSIEQDVIDLFFYTTDSRLLDAPD